VARAGPPPPVVPGDIQVPAGNKVFLVGHAVGVQIYSCNATPGGFAWGFVAPRANLYNDHGKLIITHFGGPTWQAKTAAPSWARSRPCSPSMPPPFPGCGCPPASAATGPGGDRLVDTSYIQRIATTGGLAPPAAQCTAATAGTVAEVPYTADYYFWKHTGA
jgi:hypothetical protein